MSSTPMPSSTGGRTARSTSRDDVDRGAGANAWIAFAAIVLFLNGCFGALYGLAAILNDEVVTVGGKGVTLWDFTTWGWIHMILGVVMALVAIGLFMGNRGARWIAVGLAMLNALVQFGIISAFPLWAILVIVLDIVVIYQLVARWEPDLV